jgi:hypothetical protein
MAHAETYLPGRLDALAADAVGDLLEENLPYATGRQLLADNNATIIIDGVSEIPAAERNSLRDDIRLSAARSQGANIILVGRDIAELRATLPSSVSAACYLTSELTSDQRAEIAARALAASHGTVDESAIDSTTRAIVGRLDKALGDAVGNPLLFTMGMTLDVEGYTFNDRASLYGKFVELLAERSGATGIISMAASLGIAYAKLLDHERRYSDPFEWAKLLKDAASILNADGFHVEPSTVDTMARRCGLVSPVGYTQMLTPMHDSFADYLAGKAHAQGLVSLPLSLTSGDDQRILFAAEMGGVNADLATLVARDLPFVGARIAKFDTRAMDDASPNEVERLLGYLLPAEQNCSVALWRTPDRRIIATRRAGEESGWVDGATARDLWRAGNAAVVDGGPLQVAARLWRLSLNEVLHDVAQGRGSKGKELVKQLLGTSHGQVDVIVASQTLIEMLAPAKHSSALLAHIEGSASAGQPDRASSPIKAAVEKVRAAFEELAYLGWL